MKFNEVLKIPWPIGIVAAVLFFFVFHTFQLVAPQDVVNHGFFTVIRIVAYGVIALLLLGSLLSYLSKGK